MLAALFFILRLHFEREVCILMKSLIKNLTLFIYFGIVFSGLTACTKNATNLNITSNTAVVKKDTGDYPAISQTAMQSVLRAADGSSFKLEDYKGKVVLVNFWATWCAPCRDEMPALFKLQAESKKKGFEIIGLNADKEEDLEMIKTFGEKMNLNYKLAKSNDELITELLKISRADAIPQSFLIDSEGKIRGVWVGGGPKTVAEIRSEVNKLVTAN